MLVTMLDWIGGSLYGLWGMNDDAAWADADANISRVGRSCKKERIVGALYAEWYVIYIAEEDEQFFSFSFS